MVVVTEGAKCADIAGAVGFIAVSASHGSSAPHKTNWEPLRGREVWILPDADDPGRKFAQQVAGILLDPHCKVKIVELFPDRADGSDIEQFDQSIGATPQATKAAIEELAADPHGEWNGDGDSHGPDVTCLADMRGASGSR